MTNGEVFRAQTGHIRYPYIQLFNHSYYKLIPGAPGVMTHLKDIYTLKITHKL